MFISISAIPTFTIPLYHGFTAQLPKSSGKESNKGSMVSMELHVFIHYVETRNRFQNMLIRDHGPGIDWHSCIAQDEKCFLWHPHNTNVSSDKHITDNPINICPKNNSYILCEAVFSTC
jgi:hypothetical protein